MPHQLFRVPQSLPGLFLAQKEHQQCLEVPPGRLSWDSRYLSSRWYLVASCMTLLLFMMQKELYFYLFSMLKEVTCIPPSTVHLSGATAHLLWILVSA